MDTVFQKMDMAKLQEILSGPGQAPGSRTFQHFAQRRDTHFPPPHPGDKSSGRHHPVPPAV